MKSLRLIKLEAAPCPGAVETGGNARTGRPPLVETHKLDNFQGRGYDAVETAALENKKYILRARSDRVKRAITADRKGWGG